MRGPRGAGLAGGTAIVLLLTVGAIYLFATSTGQTRLAVAVTDLPVGTPGDVTIAGPSGYARQLTASATFDVAPGTYYLVSRPRQIGVDWYYTSTARMGLTVRRGSTGHLVADYADIVPPTTHILDARRLQVLAPVTPATFEKPSLVVLSASSPGIRELHIGDVLNAGIGPSTPHGLLRKILGIRQSGDRVELVTRQAALTEALRRGKFDVRVALGQRAARIVVASSVSTLPSRRLSVGGIRLVAASEPFNLGDLSQSFGENEKDSGQRTSGCAPEGVPGLTIPKVSVNLSRPQLHWNADWGFFSGLYAHFGVTMDEQASAAITVKAAVATCQIKDKSPEVELDTLVFPVGPILIVLTPTYSFVEEAKVSVKAQAEFKVTQHLRLDVGLEYKDGNFNGFNHSHNDFTHPVTPEVSIEAEAKAGPQIALKAYDFAGPNIGESLAASATAKTDKVRTRISLSGGVHTDVGLELQLFGHGFDKSVTVLKLDKEIWSTELPNPVPASTPPPSSVSSSPPPPATSATQVRMFSPWVANPTTGVGTPPAGAAITDATGSCDSGSSDDPGRAEAYRCTPPGNGTPCFPNTISGDPGSPLLCSSDPTSNQLIRLTPASPVPTQLANKADTSAPPWFLVLADGKHCSLAGYGTNTATLPYFCGTTGVVTTAPDRTKPLWSVHEAPAGPNPTLQSAAVAVISAFA